MRAVARCLAALSLAGVTLAAAPGFGMTSALATSTTVTVTDGAAPGWVRFDDQGNGVDAHDGEIKQWGNKYYLYGTSYGCGYLRLHGYFHDTNPVTPFCGFVVYTSTDLRHWTYVGPLFDPSTTSPTNWQQTCNSATLSCYRPHVLYDAATHYFRLWVNTYDEGPDGVEHGYHVLHSASPVGPFVEDTDANGHPLLPRLAYPSGGDFDLYQDPNSGAGYIVYTARYDDLGPSYGYKLIVEQLNKNYTSGTGVFTTLDTRHTEAPSMFRRGSSYYITMADPYCAYCAGTGTSYLRASSPLGPWRGVGANVALSMNQMYVDSRMALFTGADTTTQNNLRALRDYDVTFRARGVATTSGGPTRVGWMFRAIDTSHGYFWILSNRPYGKFPARLSKELVWNGKVQSTTNIGIPTALSSTSLSLIRTRAVGPKIRTWLNGKVIDTTWMNKTKLFKWWDRNLKTGYVGIRETGGYSAYFDDFSLSRPPTLGYQMYLADNFNNASLVDFPALNTYRRHGIQLSTTSCGGQPSDVAQLRAPGTAGAEYLFQSDRWDNGDPNEAQATQYWEPLKFNADGSIQALTCGAVHTTVLSDATATTSDVSSDGWIHGLEGFSLVQDITSTKSRGQSFAVKTDGNLTAVALTLFRTDVNNDDGPSADLIVSLYDVGGPNGTPAGAPIATATVDGTQVLWSPHTVSVPISAPLAANHQYAVVLSTVSTTGAYGTARADGIYDADPSGAGLVSTGDATTPWQLEAPNDLRYALTVTTG